MIRRFGLVAALLCASAGTAAAQNVVGRANGLVGLFGNFTFDNLSADEGQAVASLTNNTVTVAFQGAYYGKLPSTTLYGPFSGSFANNAMYNYTFGQINALQMVLDFTGGPTNAAVFNFTTAVNPGAASQGATFKAFKGGIQVGILQADFAPTTSDSRALFWGFQFSDGTTFDRITIEGSPNAFGIDNLQVAKLTTTVPEPSMVGLMGLGLAGLALVVRRRRSSH